MTSRLRFSLHESSIDPPNPRCCTHFCLHRDFCIEELAQNDKQTAVSTDEKNDLEASIANLEARLSERE